MKALDWKMIAVILLVSAVFRFWGTFEYGEYIGDELLIVPAAKSLVQYGSTSEWRYPQVNSLIIASTIKMFGDNAVGWRISGVVLGIASIFLVYLIAQRLFRESRISLLAASLLAFDPFHIHFCRTAMIETPVVFFFLLFMYLLLEYTENNRCTLTLAGIAMGLTIATKAYFVFAIPILMAYVFYRECQRNVSSKVLICLEFVVKLGLLPLAIYLFTYILWFGRGYSMYEFFQFRSDAYWIFNHNFSFAHAKILARGGEPWEWFIKPISFGHHLYSEGNLARYTLEINNPLFRLMVIPALGIVLFHAIKQRNLIWFLSPVLFAASYVLFFMVNRQINSYSALAVLPFAYLSLAHAILLLARKYTCETEITALFLCMMLVSAVYLFPVSAGFWVPTYLYQPLLSISDLTKVF